MMRRPIGADRFVVVDGVLKRQCNHCGPQAINQFRKLAKSSDGLAYTCTPCQRHYAKHHYRTHQQGYVAKARTNQATAQMRIRDWLTGFVRGTRCACGRAVRFLVQVKVAPQSVGIYEAIKRGHGLASIASNASRCLPLCARCMPSTPGGTPFLSAVVPHSFVDLRSLPLTRPAKAFARRRASLARSQPNPIRLAAVMTPLEPRS